MKSKERWKKVFHIITVSSHIVAMLTIFLVSRSTLSEFRLEFLAIIFLVLLQLVIANALNGALYVAQKGKES